MSKKESIVRAVDSGCIVILMLMMIAYVTWRDNVASALGFATGTAIVHAIACVYYAVAAWRKEHADV